jgi:DNA-binding NarL/FixJ family response regulator
MLKVYLADDSVLVRSKLRNALEEIGEIQVIGGSGNAEEAIAEIGTLDLDAVIIDIRMPGGGGMPLLKYVKTLDPLPVPLSLTTFPDDEYRNTYMANGADYFFDKARDIRQMIKILNEMAVVNGVGS